MTNPDPIPARLAALKTTPMPDLKRQWRELFETEPPPFNRRYLESRLAYRIQELAYGGLKPATVKRLEALGEQLDGGNITTRRICGDLTPIAGTRLLREWQGTEQNRLSPLPSTASNGRAGPIGLSPRSPAPSPAPAGTAGSSSG